MIKSINLETDQGHLNFVLGSGNGLFEADSFNLIIGKNGSGKTFLLRNIAEAICENRHRDSIHPLCKLSFEDNSQTSRSDILHNSIAAIYFTSIPYKTKFPSSPSLFQNAAIGEDRKSSPLVNFEQYLNVAADLEIKVAPKAKMNVSKSVFFKTLVNTLAESNIREGLPDDIEYHLAEFRKIKNMQRELVDERVDLHERNEDDIRLERELSHLKVHISDSLNSIVNYKYTPEQQIALIDAFDEKRPTSDQSRTFILGFLGEYIFSDYVNRKVSKLNSKRLYELEESYRKRMDFIMNNSNLRLDSEGDGLEVDLNDKNIGWYRSNELLQKYFKLEWVGLSSGQMAILNQFSSIESKVDLLVKRYGKDTILLLIDEGDIFLHIEWQGRYIKLLNKFIGTLKKRYINLKVQLLLTTHSPILLTDIPRELIINLNNKNATIKSFSAPIQQVVNESFDAKSIGEFAKDIILKLVKTLEKGELPENFDYVMSIIDDPLIKSTIADLIKRKAINGLIN